MAPPLEPRSMSLNDVLAELGYTTAPSERSILVYLGVKRIILGGVDVFIGNACEVWAWLRKTRQIV